MGQRDLRFCGERRMAAGEKKLEPLVWKRPRVHCVLRRLRQVEQPGLCRQRAIAAYPVDRSVARRRHEPGARVRGRTISRPALGGYCEGLLRGLLGEVEVAEETDQRGENTSPLLAEGLF